MFSANDLLIKRHRGEEMVNFVRFNILWLIQSTPIALIVKRKELTKIIFCSSIVKVDNFLLYNEYIDGKTWPVSYT